MIKASRPGRVITRFGSQVLVEDGDGHVHRCTPRRRLEHVVCNDAVSWHPESSGDGVVTEVHPRSNLLERVDPRGQRKNIAANVDQVVVVTAAAPAPSWPLVDRYLVAIEGMPARALILYNKADRPDPDPESTLAALTGYQALGYPVLKTSVADGRGMEALGDFLAQGTSVLVGQSGVGKSSLIQALLPDLDIRIGALSELSGEGRHTTTNATVYRLPCGGALIDSPGVRDFSPGPTPQRELAQGFVEFRTLAPACRFHNCTHTVEPGCAVKAALEQGQIDPRRYASYCTLLEAAQV
ncbi:ribosome small subunit-dependent GTPase A [Ectothiorhodospira magna]|nr:ribosome small subunit-dependent GTPase A [Ectothiorhodospira magna]